MNELFAKWKGLTDFLSGRFIESILLLMTRIALGGIFWRSYSNTVVEGTWFQIDPFQYEFFRSEFSGLPLAPEIAVPITFVAEFTLPLLLFFGFSSRIAAAGLAIMALVIQIFVFPTWAHFLGWDIMVLAMAGLIISRGAGWFSLDWLLERFAVYKSA